MTPLSNSRPTQSEEPTPFNKFEDLAKRLFAVPKRKR